MSRPMLIKGEMSVREKKVFERNKYEDLMYWPGVISLPELEEEAIGDEVLYDESSIEYEVYLDEWWEDFVSAFYL